MLTNLSCASTSALSSEIAYAGVYLPDPNHLRASAVCEATQHHRVYHFFFGTTTIDRREPAAIFPDPERYYYLVENNKTPSDWVVSILFGTFFTVTRSSLFVTPCEIPAGRAAVAPFQSAPAPRAGTGVDAAINKTVPPGIDSGERRPPTASGNEAVVRERIDAARERARAARDRAKKLGQEQRN
ncbi:MAG: hypothetical protein RIF32_13080 [Leptospirales bacterium]